MTNYLKGSHVNVKDEQAREKLYELLREICEESGCKDRGQLDEEGLAFFNSAKNKEAAIKIIVEQARKQHGQSTGITGFIKRKFSKAKEGAEELGDKMLESEVCLWGSATALVTGIIGGINIAAAGEYRLALLFGIIGILGGTHLGRLLREIVR